MISDLSKTLRFLLTPPVIPGVADVSPAELERAKQAYQTFIISYAELAAALITFERPDESFKPTQTSVNVFLYDIRENLDLRSIEPEVIRQNGQVINRRPLLRIACSYLITAWPVGGSETALQEQRLLSQILRVLSKYPTIDYPLMQGDLPNNQAFQLPMNTALVDPQKNLSEFWTALGNKMRPSITVTVTICVPVFDPLSEPMVITHQIKLGERASEIGDQINPKTEQTLFNFGGLVLKNGVKQRNLDVKLVELGLTTTTNEQGQYWFSAIPAGNFTLSVRQGEVSKSVEIKVPALKPDAEFKGYDVIWEV